MGGRREYLWRDPDGVLRWHPTPDPASTDPRLRPRWPLHSDAAAVHPTQIAEYSEAMRMQGVALDFDPEGRAVFTGPGQRRKALKLMGLHDNCGYD